MMCIMSAPESNTQVVRFTKVERPIALRLFASNSQHYRRVPFRNDCFELWKKRYAGSVYSQIETKVARPNLLAIRYNQTFL
jgi:hypothetical protein